MTTINNFSDYTSKYNTNVNNSLFFSGMIGEGTEEMFSVADYASIKNGSYGKLLEAYYAKEDAAKLSQKGESQHSALQLRTSADSLMQSANALNDNSLWEKKIIKKKDEKTGEEIEVEDYDRNAIVKAVKRFTEDYNDLVKEAGKSNTDGVLRNAVWMTNMTEKNKNLLAKVGITIGKGNKLEIDEEKLKVADMNDLKTLFLGQHSFANKVLQKANSIKNTSLVINKNYSKTGDYSKDSSEVHSEKVDVEV